MSGQGNDRQSAALRGLARRKLHLVPGALARLPTGIGEHFASPWTSVNILQLQLRPFPAGLLEFWTTHERGHVLIGSIDRGYVPGPQPWRRRVLDGVAYMALPDLATGSRRPLMLVGYLLDHLLGCSGAIEGAWLSDGGGITPRWRDVGGRLRELVSLGYSVSESGAHDAHAYLAGGLAAYCHDRRQLNVADPLLERLLRTTVMSDAFWAAKGGACAY